MKKVGLFLLFNTTLFAESITLDNQTAYPTKQSKMAVQWANSAREVDEDNKALMYGEKLNPDTCKPSLKQGKSNSPSLKKHSNSACWSGRKALKSLITPLTGSISRSIRPTH